MIEELLERRLLSISRSRSGMIGYRFAGVLYEALEALDACLVQVLGAGLSPTRHSCTTLIEPDVLQRIGQLECLPNLPFHAIPHGVAPTSSHPSEWILSPSSCYSTFAHLEGSRDAWPLRCFTTRGRCHRHEPVGREPTRMSAFEMRELVLIGDPDAVVHHACTSFERSVGFLRALGGDISVARASDTFYGELAGAARRVQFARGVKWEARLPWSNGAPVAVGSRNVHQTTFTGAFAIGPQTPLPALHSACVAYGLERLLLTLLAGMSKPHPDELLARIEDVASAMRPTGQATHPAAQWLENGE